MALWGSQRQILWAVVDLPKDPTGHVRDSQIARSTGIDLADVQDWLMTLEDDGFVIIARSADGFGTYETAAGRLELKKVQSKSQKSEAGPSGEGAKGRDQSKIRPKGLRAFDKEDADFFLELLPGPYDQQSLPDGISFWKVRIEGSDSDRTFSVGMIYGPSGSGKSSLIKAGLLPRLSDHVLPVNVEATAGETESLLLKGLRKRCPDLPPDLGLADSLDALRQSRSLPSGKKVLLVIDQFEQWLVARRAQPSTGLVEALRHCDEERVQAILLVRDDYLSAAIKFMGELGFEFRPSRNARRVDLFGRPHAKKVLAAFGQSYGVLGDDLTPEQQAFLNQAVDGLARDGVVIPVRLALFAEMLKGRKWTLETLKEIGGAEGVGVAFLEEAFCSDYADPRLKNHQEAARSVLKCLLPLDGRPERETRSNSELLSASGYHSKPEELNQLLGILDEESRLITCAGNDCPSGGSQSDRRYRLTHEYMVAPIRSWLSMKDRESEFGRARLFVTEWASSWRQLRSKKLLLTKEEFLSIKKYSEKLAEDPMLKEYLQASINQIWGKHSLLWKTRQ